MSSERQDLSGIEIVDLEYSLEASHGAVRITKDEDGITGRWIQECSCW